MAIAITNIGTAQAKTGATTASISVPVGGVPTGSLIIIAEVVGTNNAGPNHGTLSDTAGNSYLTGQTSTNASHVWAGYFYAFNSLALVSGNTISQAWTSSSMVWSVSACYATGIKTSADPTNAVGTATGASGTAMSVSTSTAAAVGDLVIGCMGLNGPSGDTVTQDSTNASYATPLNSIGTSGGSAASNVNLFGGSAISVANATISYGPADSTSQRAWAGWIATFSAAPTGPQTYNDTITESGSAADSFATTMVMPNTITEAGSANDSYVGGLLLINTLMETGSAVDSYATIVTWGPTLSEAGVAADSYVVAATCRPSYTEADSATDSYAAIATFIAVLTETGSATDSYIGGLLLLETISETGAASDLYAAVLTARAAISEAGAASDSHSALIIFNATLLEAGLASDAYLNTAILNVSLLEPGEAADSYTATGGGGGPTITGNIWPWVRKRRRLT